MGLGIDAAREAGILGGRVWTGLLVSRRDAEGAEWEDARGCWEL
jgi:hypothetical protein